MRLDKRNFKDILIAVDRRLEDGAAFDGYRDGASRMNTPSLGNKGESTLDIERNLVADQSTAQAEDPARLRRWIAAYTKDLPNFICDYTEEQYEPGRWVSKWVLKKEHSGKVRFIDGDDEYQVLSLNGQPIQTTIWKVSNLYNPFAAMRYKLSPAANYRFTPKGEG